MALFAFADFALDFDLVFAVSTSGNPAMGGRGQFASLYIDMPGEAEAVVVELRGADAVAVDRLVVTPPRVWRSSSTFSFDESKICRVDVPDVHPGKGRIRFKLERERIYDLMVEREAALLLLAELRQRVR